MSRGRKPIPVTALDLQNTISQIEQGGAFASRSALWDAVANTDWAKSIGLTAQVAMLKAKSFALQIKTPVGRRGRLPGQGPVNVTGKRTKRKRIPLDMVPTLKRMFNESLHSRIDRAAAGSLKAAVALMCVDCSGGSKKEVSLCGIRTCPLWGFRPFQGDAYKSETPANSEVDSNAAVPS
jgi:hypothetical protein